MLYQGKALAKISLADKIGYVVFGISLPAFVWWGFAL